MPRSIRHLGAVLSVAVATAACGGTANDVASDNAGRPVQTASSATAFGQAATAALAEGRQAMEDRGLTEARLDAATAKLEPLVMQAAKSDAGTPMPNVPELMSTLGALYVRKAAFHADNGLQAAGFVSQGYRYLDRAVAMYPDNIAARLSRGITSAKVPEFLNKTGVARDDLRFVVNSSAYAKLPPDLQASVRATLDDVERRLSKSSGQS